MTKVIQDKKSVVSQKRKNEAKRIKRAIETKHPNKNQM
jgi:hypothetical protein